MIGSRLKKILLVAPEVFPEQLIAGYAYVKHVSSPANIFPSIFEFNPDLIVFDYDFLGRDLEKILRRIQTNKFYNKVKITCYKSDANLKVDGFLKVLGVDQFVYKEDLVKAQQPKKVFSNTSSIIDTSIMKLVASVSN
jgi:hypothetical protein